MRNISRLTFAAALLAAPLAATAQPAPSVTAPSVTATTHNADCATPGSCQTIVTPVNSPQGSSTVTISGGSLAGQAIMWLALVLGAPLGGLAVAWFVRLMKKMGVDVSDANRARLQEMVENGIALAAKNAQADLKGKLPIEVQNQVASDAVRYAQDHGADTLKALGFDPADPKTVEALEARAAKVLADLAPPPLPGA